MAILNVGEIFLAPATGKKWYFVSQKYYAHKNIKKRMVFLIEDVEEEESTWRLDIQHGGINYDFAMVMNNKDTHALLKQCKTGETMHDAVKQELEFESATFAGKMEEEDSNKYVISLDDLKEAFKPAQTQKDEQTPETDPTTNGEKTTNIEEDGKSTPKTAWDKEEELTDGEFAKRMNELMARATPSQIWATVREFNEWATVPEAAGTTTNSQEERKTQSKKDEEQPPKWKDKERLRRPPTWKDYEDHYRNSKSGHS